MTKLKVLVLTMACVGYMQVAIPAFTGGEIRQAKSGRTISKGGINYVWDGSAMVPAGSQISGPKVPSGKVPASQVSAGLPADVIAQCQQLANDPDAQQFVAQGQGLGGAIERFIATGS
ncbi:hypothetical protein KAZ82_00235 [Candidatus Babeliales bacterium]|nr:hypothetical protein [Candidatus Babeliales bacterium]